MPAVSEDFDAYHKWLAIPPKDQPPNHYRLLGLDLFEFDPDVIAAAAEQRMAHVRTYQLGAQSGLSQKILNEIAAAKVCLLVPEQKAAYDEKLRQQLRPAAPPAQPVNQPTRAPVPILAAPPASSPLRVPVAEAKPIPVSLRPRRRNRPWPVLEAVGIGAVILAVFLAFIIPGPDQDQVVRNDRQPLPANASSQAAASRAADEPEEERLGSGSAEEPQTH